ncbi:MAG TPA: hypothetical protein PK364_12115 [Synergistaceae bacterium]|nr:hypothetical protein [Synergistaceae bacterium]HPJ26703.1 hypothetical protein [Synergistaceae bacterium]HPQ38582.1 hypothetical protein [Synergistaceae bacterium]
MQKKMWAVRILLVSVVALFTLAVSTAAFAAVQDFTIVNNTGTDLYGLFISSAASESWEENMIEGQVFPAGNSLTVSFEGFDRNQCIWDIMVSDENEDALTWEGLNLCEISQVVLNWNGEEGWVDLQ